VGFFSPLELAVSQGQGLGGVGGDVPGQPGMREQRGYIGGIYKFVAINFTCVALFY